MTKHPDQRAILVVFIDWPRDSEIKDQTKGDRLLWLNQPPGLSMFFGLTCSCFQ